MVKWAAALAIAPISTVHASESITYSYDALGRLTNAATTGGVDNALSVTYALDLADNRTLITVTGSTGGGMPDITVIVLPLNGYTIIPIVSQP